jgi:pimeloyl-ACP methyl ester carboxylesterase
VERHLGTRPPIKIPTVILHGGDDAVSSRASARELAQFPAGTERRVIPGVGHFMPREAPGALVDALGAVLR